MKGLISVLLVVCVVVGVFAIGAAIGTAVFEYTYRAPSAANEDSTTPAEPSLTERVDRFERRLQRIEETVEALREASR